MSLFNELLASETETYCIFLCYGMDYGHDEWNRTEFLKNEAYLRHLQKEWWAVNVASI